MTKTLAITALGFSLLAAPLLAQAPGALKPADEITAGEYTLDTTHSNITWVVNHLGFADYQGRFTNFDAGMTYDPADPANSTLRVAIPLENVDSGVPQLDDHMKRDLFDMENHPEAVFEATGIEVTGDATGIITGDLTMNGVTRPVALDATFTGAGTHPFSQRYTVGFEAETTIKRSEFGFDDWLPVIGDDVTLIITAEFNQPAPEEAEE